MEMRVYNYRPGLKILNIEQLPKGTGAKFLECICNSAGDLIAKQWRHGMPCTFEAIIRFPGALGFKERGTEQDTVIKERRQ